MNERLTKTSAAAVASLVLGIASMLCLGFLAGIPAVICGHLSLARMKKDTLLAGRPLAIAGLIMGYVGTAWSLVLIIVMIVLSAAAPQSSEPFVYPLF